MPKNRKKPRRGPPRDDRNAPTPLVGRIDTPPVSIEEERRLLPARLDELLRIHGVEPQPWMHALEERIGGMAFGELYFRVHLGFWNAFWAYHRTGKPGNPSLGPAGERLLRVGIEGDTHYYVSLEGEAWTQDGIADHHPHWASRSFDELSARLNWPAETRAPIRDMLGP